MKYTNLKLELKTLACRIKELKSHRKVNNRGNWKLYDLHFKIWKMKREFRHKHIAYCLLRGRSYEQIEQPAEYNQPDMGLVSRYMEQFNETAENVCASS